MPLPYHVIDGYNLLHAAGLARETYGPGDYERARTALLLRISDGLGDDERERTTVVFDAFDPPAGAASGFRFREIAVRFAIETGEADQLIETLIRRHSSPRQLRVVSDDIRLQRAAKRRGASAVKCDAFLRRLERRATSPLHSEPPNRPPAADANDWHAYFGLTGDDLTAEITDPPAGPAASASPAAGLPPPGKARHSPQGGASTAGRAARSAKRNARRTKPPPAAEAPPEPAEDLSFWQRRIDKALAEDQANRPRRSESS